MRNTVTRRLAMLQIMYNILKYRKSWCQNFIKYKLSEPERIVDMQ